MDFYYNDIPLLFLNFHRQLKVTQFVYALPYTYTCLCIKFKLVPVRTLNINSNLKINIENDLEKEIRLQRIQGIQIHPLHLTNFEKYLSRFLWKINFDKGGFIKQDPLFGCAYFAL